MDETRTVISNRVLKLLISAPKEKRKGHPIIIPYEINYHPDKTLFPVETYRLYHANVTVNLCPEKHSKDNDLEDAKYTDTEDWSNRSTVEAKAGVPLDSILAQTFWHNYEILDTYYRLYRTTETNIAQTIIPLDSLNTNSSNGV
ncbi:hypothetical protein AYI68_g8212 [Smittium mucronatum]|uniref:Uncharacterized protein n=1 Tax=Smittium mucronatum TaxID=133383 RepID=A0A1R0GLI7_9FUNG|nr:hypothetical protein AYI68_g8212 [Smittium mucronatum]